MTGNKTFVRITNQDIYRKLNGIDHKLSKINGTVGWHSKAIGAIILILTVLIAALV